MFRTNLVTLIKIFNMVSLIMTVLNEAEHLSKWFESISEQTKMPDEIVIVDGGSTDGTYEFLETAQQTFENLKVYRTSGNIAHGRNFAISKAGGEIIAVTDAGCIYAKDWFEKLTAPIVAGRAKWAATGFGPWLESNDRAVLYAIAAATTPGAREFNRNWLPSSRSVAFKREVWEAAKGYPEWIPFCEDVLFDLEIFKAGFDIEYVREPLVFWKPRPSVVKYLRQLYNYTRSEGHGRLNYRRQAIRYAVYTTALFLLFSGLFFSKVYWLVILLGLILYMIKFWRRWFEFTRGRWLVVRLYGLVLVPVIVAAGDVAKMCGFVVGVCERRWKKEFHK